MKKLSFLLLISIIFFSGCSVKKYSLPESKVYINNTDFSKIDSLKTGEVCKRRILLLFPFGKDLTSQNAAKNGGIKNIKYQETSKTMFFPFYSSVCLKVYGN